MTVLRMRVRIDRPRGNPTGYAHHADERRLLPPGHEERLLAHEERIARDLARLSRTSRGEPSAVTYARLQDRRERAAGLLLAAGDAGLTRAELGRALGGVAKATLPVLLRHPWFRTRRGDSHRRNLPWVVTLTPEGRAEAERLAREGSSHADQ